LIFFTYSISTIIHGKLEKIDLYLKWRHQFQFAGYYAAEKNGYYKDEDLEVNFIENKGLNAEKIKKIVSNSGNYGIETQRLLLDKENRDKIKILSVIFQHSPIVAITLKTSGITTPQQFIDKKIYGDFLSIEIKAMLIKEGVDYNSIKYVKRTESGYGKFIRGEVDMMLGYTTSLPYRLKSQNVDFYIIKPTEYGVDFYGDFIFTSNKEINEHPKRVKKFLRASLKGWNYAMANKDEIIRYMISHYNTKATYEELLYEANSMENDIMMSKYIEIGHMNIGRWKYIEKILKKLNLVDKIFNIENFLYIEKDKSIWEHKYFKYLLYGTSVLSFIALFLFLFNLKLNKEVENRARELKDNESKFRAIFNNNFQFTGILDLNGKVLLVNNAYLVIIKKTNKDIEGKYFWDTPWFSHSQKEQEKIKNSIEEVKKEGFLRFEIEQHSFNNKPYYVDFSIKTAIDDYGEIKYLIVEGRDITDYKNMVEKVKNTQKMEAIGVLAGGIAHDFNNIISAILGYTELLKSDEKSDTDLNYLSQIKNASQRAKELVSRIVTFSKGVEEKRANINLSLLINDIVNLVRPTIKSSDININVNFKNISPIYVVYTQIEQVIMNIIRNAVQSIDKKGNINIVLDKVDIKEKKFLINCILPPNQYLLLTISDTGTGIKKKNLDKIFEPYFSTKNKKEGTGLGLFVVHGIMIKHNSYIDVISEVDKGTTFYLYFPISSKKFDIVNIEKKEQFTTSVLNNKNILFVDDEEMIMKSMSLLLTKKGFNVDGFINPEEAYIAFKENPQKYNLIITDQSMPQMTGIELVSKVKDINKDITIILCSGYNNIINENNKKDYDIDKYIEKPVSLDELVSSIEHLLTVSENNKNS
jgi:PAS domain S-box-containing protein